MITECNGNRDLIDLLCDKIIRKANMELNSLETFVVDSQALHFRGTREVALEIRYKEK